jgi:hypothetical protein
VKRRGRLVEHVENQVVVVRLQEGLGNQLFQLAAGIGLATERGADLYVVGSDADLAGLRSVTAHPVSPAPPALARRVRFRPSHNGWKVARTLKNNVDRKLDRIVYVKQAWRDPFSAVGGHPAGARSFIYLDGFFQNAQWFEPALPVMLASRSSVLLDVIAQARLHRATVVSLRRGDYVRLGWALPRQYYEAAFRALGSVDGPVWVVGDDPLANDAIAALASKTIGAVEPAPRFTDDARINDLGLLAAASTVVMANSTFCWWGVVLGEGDDHGHERTVLSPEPWNAAMPRAELRRPGWRAIDA